MEAESKAPDAAATGGMDVILKRQAEMNDDPPPLEDEPEEELTFEAEWKENILDFVNSKIFAGLMMVFTFYALFGDDIRLAASEKPDDAIFFTISSIALGLFLIELVLNMVAKKGYIFGFYFWLDLASTFSLIPDIGWIWDPLVGGDSSAGAQSAALRGARGARAGTKAGRAVRIVRLVRMVRIVKLYKMTAGDEAVDVAEDAGAEPSLVGKKLTELTTRRVIVIVLMMILMLPILDRSVLREDFDINQELGLVELHQLASPYYDQTLQDQNESLVTEHMLKQKVLEYVRSAGKLMYMNLCGDHGLNGEGVTVLSNATWIKNIKFQEDFTKDYKLSINPLNQWDPSYHLLPKSDIIKRFRAEEVTQVSVSDTYARALSGQTLNSKAGATGTLKEISVSNPCVSEAIFYIRDVTRRRAGTSIGKTFFVMVVLTSGVMLFTNDSTTLVIEPIERMMKIVKKLAENPLHSTTKRKVSNREKADQSAHETMLLEKTLQKIGGLLQVGFGAAGAEIIGKNMTGDGDLDAMVPGKLITSVFGFCIIDNFTETCSYLGADITRYINTVAGICHGNVHKYFGSANKNIGCAFLMAWKICDGKLFGLRDPRDADQSRLPVDALRKGRAGVTIRNKGSGSLDRDLSPEELIDASLAAFVKSHYDITRANRDGGIFTEFNQHLREKAANPGEMHPDDIETFKDFHVHMGFGMHIGWAIEGAIGSKYKIDASYLSPNVNMSARLEAATHQFQTSILVSEWFYNELSVSARRFCRMVDRICVVGSKIPMEIWTVDVFNYDIDNFLEPIVGENGVQKLADWGTNEHFRAMQRKKGLEGWLDAFKAGVDLYIAGDFAAARAALEQAEKINPGDGPTLSLLKQMKLMGNKAPADWADASGRGFRQLTSK